MNLQELEHLFRETNKEVLTFEMIDYFRSMKGKPYLTVRQKLNLCAQEKYSDKIQRVYIPHGKSYVSGFEFLKEDSVKVDNIFY